MLHNKHEGMKGNHFRNSAYKMLIIVKTKGMNVAERRRD